MCGICGIILADHGDTNSKVFRMQRIFECADAIQHRGPDNTHKEALTETCGMVFHRLAIMDPSAEGDQPLRDVYQDGNVLICNGEIYNFRELKQQHGFMTHSNSDCEVILDMHRTFGFKETLNHLDGVFAIMLYDKEKDMVFMARDRFGVRSMSYAITEEGDFIVASEPLVFAALKNNKNVQFRIIKEVTPGTWTHVSLAGFNGRICVPEFKQYYKPLEFDVMLYKNSWEHGDDYYMDPNFLQHILLGIEKLFTSAVQKRLMSDRPIGFALSGGVDSCSVAFVGLYLLSKMGYDTSQVETYTIGFEGSPDLLIAERAGKILEKRYGCRHIQFIMTQQEALEFYLPLVFKHLATWDTTTIRASVFNYALCHKISQRGKCIVLFNGDGSDEIFGSYQGMALAPSASDFAHENAKLLRDIHYFDVRRSDHSAAGNGLEARTPFLDYQLCEFVMKNIPPQLKQHQDEHGEFRIEKWILREALRSSPAQIPDFLLYRPKEAFSDGVSIKKTKSWFEILHEYILLFYPECKDNATLHKSMMSKKTKTNETEMDVPPPRTVEEYYYRRKFLELYGPDFERLIPYYWMPPSWCGDVIDPSARTLNHYKDLDTKAVPK